MQHGARYAIQNFYINEQQSLYLLSHKDAKKIRKWLRLCQKQLELLGYHQVSLLGSGAFGFVFSGRNDAGEAIVFKFSRITLPLSIRERLEDEARMLNAAQMANVPKYYTYVTSKRQGILMMARAPGDDLEALSLRYGKFPIQWLLIIAQQLAQLLMRLRMRQVHLSPQPIVHGDIKPSNLIFDEQTQQVSLIDWGSSVFAQHNADGSPVVQNVMDLMSSDVSLTNARMGDVFFIGNEQLQGKPSSPRFDEQGVAATLYALASGQSARFGIKALPATSLGLPQEFANTLQHMLTGSYEQRCVAGDYFLRRMPWMSRVKVAAAVELPVRSFLPIWVSQSPQAMDTVVYSSRKSFLRQHDDRDLSGVKDNQLDRYYKEYLIGMDDTAKAFLTAVSRLAKYPVLGGLSIHWQGQGVSIESSLMLYDESLRVGFTHAVNNVVRLSQAISKQGLFKCCLFDARNSLQLPRESACQPFLGAEQLQLKYEVTDLKVGEKLRKSHSYFEDGQDPDEQLQLPDTILDAIAQLNLIHHTGCIIFEAMPQVLKIHHYYRLLDASQEQEFQQLLTQIMAGVAQINGLGVSGFMKLPYKNTRAFDFCAEQPEHFMQFQ